MEAQREDLISGPRLQTAGVIIEPTNGLLDDFPGVDGAIPPQGLTVHMSGLPQPWADGVDGVRKKVREVLRYGVHFVKFKKRGKCYRWIR